MKMKKTICSLVLSLLLVFGVLPLAAFAAPSPCVWVNGVALTADTPYLAENTAKTAVETADSFVAYFDAENAQLTLNGIVVTVGYFNEELHYADGDGIYCETDLELILRGENFIGSEEAPMDGDGVDVIGALQISGDGDLTVYAFADAVFAMDSLSVNGDGVFQFTSVEDDGFCSRGPLTLNGGTYSVFCDDDGIDATDITLNAVDLYMEAYDHGIEGDAVTVNSGEIYALSSGDEGIYVDALQMNGGKVVAVGCTDGVDVSGKITVTDGILFGYSVWDDAVETGALEVNGGAVVAVSNAENEEYNGIVIETEDGFLLNGGVVETNGISQLDSDGNRVPYAPTFENGILVYFVEEDVCNGTLKGSVRLTDLYEPLSIEGEWTADENVQITTADGAVPEWLYALPVEVQQNITVNGAPLYTAPHTCAPTLVAEKAPTCDKPGQKAYYHCECGKNYEDAAGTVEIADLSAYGILAATGHKDADKNGVCDTCGAILSMPVEIPKTGGATHVCGVGTAFVLAVGASLVFLKKKKENP